MKLTIYLIFLSLALQGQTQSEILGNLKISDTLEISSLANGTNRDLWINENGKVTLNTDTLSVGLLGSDFVVVVKPTDAGIRQQTYLTVTSGDPSFSTSVNLPRNIKITKFTMYYVDNSDLGNITCSLSKFDPARNLAYRMTTLSTEGSPSVDADDTLTLETTQFQFNQVETDFHFITLDSDQWEANNLTFWGAKVEYVFI